jgi:hypothetical protein
LQLALQRLDEPVIWQRTPSEEDVEHQGDPLDAEHVISGWLMSLNGPPLGLDAMAVPVGRDLDPELWRLLFAIDNGSLRQRRLGTSQHENDVQSALEEHTSSSSSIPLKSVSLRKPNAAEMNQTKLEA